MTWRELRDFLNQRILDSDEIWHVNIFYGDVSLARVDDLEIRSLDWSGAYEEGRLCEVVGGTRSNVEAAMPYNCLECGCAVLEAEGED